MRSPGFNHFALLCLTLGAALGAACDGSALGPTARSVKAAPDEPVTPDTPDVPVDVPAVPVPIDVATPLLPAAPTRRPLPSGLTEGATLVVARSAILGHFLFGLGADPDGVVASLGGGAAGLSPLRAVIDLIDEEDASGTFEIRALDVATGLPVDGDDGLIEAYPYVALDAASIRVDFSQALTPLEIAVYDSCRFTLSGYELHAPPVYADGLLTWPADETYTRSGQCQWFPRQATGLHVHYLRHELAGRDFVPRALDPDSPFGFFLAGTTEAPLLARLPGIAADEPARTYTYYLSGFPELYVPAAQQTFEAWNDALEEITGRRPFEVALAPHDLIAWDPRYHAVVWDASSGAGAVAPFTEDPDTGEIFQSLVVMWFGDLGDLVTTYDDFFGKHPEVASALAPNPAPAPSHERDLDFVHSIARPLRPLHVLPRTLTRRTFVRRPFDAARISQALSKDLSDEEVSHLIVVDFLLHELGHNLGLRHNFIGSVDKHRHSEAQTSSSTMDYVIGMFDPGSYDRDAMRYGYGEAPPLSEDYLYCTDETTERDAACVQWDYGHPVRYELELLDSYLAAYPPDTAAADAADALRYLDAEFNRARMFVNTDYELWDETPVATFDELLQRVDCGRECASHSALRSSLALYLLYSRHMVTAWWEPAAPNIWLDFPALTDTQAALLMSSYFDLVVARAEPLDLRTAIVQKLPTSAVSGAKELLTELHDHFANLPALSEDDARVKAAVDDAFAKL